MIGRSDAARSTGRRIGSSAAQHLGGLRAPGAEPAARRRVDRRRRVALQRDADPGGRRPGSGTGIADSSAAV